MFVSWQKKKDKKHSPSKCVVLPFAFSNSFTFFLSFILFCTDAFLKSSRKPGFLTDSQTTENLLIMGEGKERGEKEKEKDRRKTKHEQYKGEKRFFSEAHSLLLHTVVESSRASVTV